MDLAQCNSIGEDCGRHAASSVFLILVYIHMESIVSIQKFLLVIILYTLGGGDDLPRK